MALEVMMDIETMSTRHDAAILSIGAVKFDPHAAPGKLGDAADPEYKHFYCTIELGSCIEAEMHIEGRTVMWWMEQTEAARIALRQEPHYNIDSALSMFFHWYGQESMPTWGNGAGFDNVIVRNAFERLGGIAPYRFFDDRCFRTLKAMYPEVKYVPATMKHHALEDAMAQAVHVQRVFQFRNSQQLV